MKAKVFTVVILLAFAAAGFALSATSAARAAVPASSLPEARSAKCYATGDLQCPCICGNAGKGVACSK